MKSGATSIAVREMQIKTMTRCRYLPSIVVKVKNTIVSGDKDAEQLELSALLVDMQSVTTSLEKLGIFLKT